MQARVVLLILGVAVVAAPLTYFVGTHVVWPFAVGVTALTLATAGAIAYAELHNRRQRR